MSRVENLKQDLAPKFPIDQFKFTHAFGDDVLVIPKEHIVPLLSYFKQSDRFDFLMDICGVHYPNRPKPFDVVYHLFSSKDASRLRVKVELAEGEAVDSALPVW